MSRFLARQVRSMRQVQFLCEKEEFTMKHLLVIGLLIGLSIGSWNCQPKLYQVSGRRLIVAISEDLTTMNPLAVTNANDRSIRSLMFEPLLGVDSKGKFQPYLAESWEVSADGRHYTFQLRKGVKFHDGREMTAMDAKYAIENITNPENQALRITQSGLVESVTVFNKHTLKVSIKEARAGFLTLFTPLSYFSVIPKGSLEEGVSTSNRFPPGTGPFKFVEWKRKLHFVVDRFDAYWGQKACVDRLILRPIRSAHIRLTARQAGDVDVVGLRSAQAKLFDGKCP